jgi:ABC-2 type transport system ATP-binding protein
LWRRRRAERHPLLSDEEAHYELEGLDDPLSPRLADLTAPASLGRALEVRDLHVSYGPKVAVDGVNLEVDDGEIFGLLGPNGAGKTTTLSAIEGLLRPQSGSILLGGIDIQADSLRAKARMGVLFQSTSFQPELTIRQLLKLYAALDGVPLSSTEIVERLKSVGLSDEASRLHGQLSGGQQQRVALLVATIHNPALVLLDEPTAGLDPQARRQLWSHIEQIRAEGRSILLTTHSMEEAQAGAIGSRSSTTARY